MKYLKIFKDSWHELCTMFRNGNFSPNQEQDIICMIYHLCLDKLKYPKLIHAASTWGFDLILGSMREERQVKIEKFNHFLLAEFKFILSKGRKNRRLKRAVKDIEKLSAIGSLKVRRIFAIFDKVNCLEREEIVKLKRIRKNVTVIYGPT